MPKLAVQYSAAADELRRSGTIEVDCYKCPDWPHLIAEVQARYPLYVHFPLRTGAGRGDTINTETNRPPDWDLIAQTLAHTATPFVNVHLVGLPKDLPTVPRESYAAEHVAQLVEALSRD